MCVRVDEVDAGVFVFDEDVAGFEFGNGEVGFVLEDFGAAVILDDDAAHGGRDGGHFADSEWRNGVEMGSVC